MSDLLFDVPWWLFGSLLILGGIVGWTGLQKRQKGSVYAGIVLVLLAAGLKTLSYFVETDKEKCTRQTTQLVDCVQQHNWATFESLLEDDVNLDTSEGTIFGNHQTLLEGARKATDVYNPVNVTSTITKVLQDQSGITVDLDVSSEGNGTMGYRVPTSWKLIWERTGKDWRLHEITCLRIGNETGHEMAHRISP